MFRFAHPEMFYLLLAVPVLVGLWIAARRAWARRVLRFGDPATVGTLIPELSPRRVRRKFILLLIAFVMIVLAMARPQSGAKLRERVVTGVETILVVDVSNSMLAQDLPPTRLDNTKAAIGRLLSSVRRESVGLVVFAGDAYVQLPVTADHTTARQFAERLATDMVSGQGTAVGAAIDLAAASFSPGEQGARAIILISDGENHEDDALAAAQRAAEAGITIYTIGIGTPEGSPIEIDGDYLRDENDKVVVTRLDEDALQRIALSTGGAYVRATPQNFGLDEIAAKIDATQATKHTETVFSQYDEYFQYPLVAALFVLLLEFVILSRRNRLLAKFNIFK